MHPPPPNTTLTQIWLNRPSVIRNTLMIAIIRIMAGVLSLALLIVGVTMIINYELLDTLLHKFIPATFEIDSDQEKQTAIFIGAAAMVLSLLMSFVVWLCKMLLRRNFFINELELYMHQENDDMEKFKTEMDKINERE